MRSRLIAVMLAGLTVLAGCSGGASGTGTFDPNPTDPPWFGVPMTDVNSGRQFQIADFKGRVVLLETMAIWCAACKAEMDEMRGLIAAVGPDRGLVVISLDVDVNEDAAMLKKYAEQNGFDWLIAVAPSDVAHFLARNYDAEYLNPPLQPMLVVDRKGGVWGLPFGMKSAVSLEKTLERYLAEE